MTDTSSSQQKSTFINRIDEKYAPQYIDKHYSMRIDRIRKENITPTCLNPEADLTKGQHLFFKVDSVNGTSYCTIKFNPECTCQDFKTNKPFKCKHIISILMKYFKLTDQELKEYLNHICFMINDMKFFEQKRNPNTIQQEGEEGEEEEEQNQQIEEDED